MRDPVTGFDYPEAWVLKCRSPDRLEKAASGLAVLTASGTVLLRGFTTGTTAAAACKAAILSLSAKITSVRISTPCGLVLDVPVSAAGGRAECRKFAGDYPGDITSGLLFVATASVQESGIEVIPGTGIGRYARDTPRFKKGTPAITPAPLACILRSMEEAMEETGVSGATVTLSVPDGEKVAAKTLNSRVGVEGGISVLGTTGLVEPWDDHLTASALDRIARSPRVVLTTGRIGLRYARLRYPDHDVVLVGSKIGDALAAAEKEVILFGLPALVLKYINPVILAGTGFSTIEELSATEQFHPLLQETLVSFAKRQPSVRVVIINRDGQVVGESI
jgi:cobalt-precorrin-5B (C1)-methyltransferase